MPITTRNLFPLVRKLRQFLSYGNIDNAAQPIDSSNILELQTSLQTCPVGVTELPACGEQELNDLLPFLASMTRRRKWVVLVAPPYVMPMPRLQRAGVDSSRFMVVRARSPEGKAWAVQQALRSRNCGVVLFWSTPLEAGERLRLEAAALEGETSCIGFIESFNQLVHIGKAA
jgi:cell division inhibitor SulA